jgi:hypothetical protein
MRALGLTTVEAYIEICEPREIDALRLDHERAASEFFDDEVAFSRLRVVGTLAARRGSLPSAARTAAGRCE